MPRVKKKSFIQKNGLIAIWAMAGFIAIGYIGFLAVGVDPITGKSSMATKGIGPGGSNAHQRQVAALASQVNKLNRKEARLAHKLRNLERSLGPMTSSITGSSKTTPPPSVNNSGYGIDEIGTAAAKSPPLPATAYPDSSRLDGGHQASTKNSAAALPPDVKPGPLIGVGIMASMIFAIFTTPIVQPIIAMRTVGYFVRRMGLEGKIDFAATEQSQAALDRTGEGLAEGFDIDAF